MFNKCVMVTLCLLLAGLIFPTAILAQEATPEVTQEALPETTPEPNVIARTYSLFVPSGYDDTQPTPLILALHGAGGSGSSLREFLEFDSVAEEAGYIVAYPDSIGSNWTFTGKVELPDGGYADDVTSLSVLLDILQADYNIDPAQMYVMGYSNGASMGYRLVCEMPGTFVGLAAVAAPLGWRNTLICVKHPNQSTSLLLMQGTDDQVLPWQTTYNSSSDQLVTLSAPETARFWAALLDCDYEDYTLTEVPDINPDDESLVRVLTFAICPNHMESVLYAVIGGGHSWPGRASDMPILNPVNMDIDANEVILDWFASLTQAD